MPFYVKYVKGGSTIVEELHDCHNRGEAVGRLKSYKEIADDNGVGLTSDPARLAQWQELVRQEAEITPRQSTER